MKFADVALDLPIPGFLTYAVPPRFKGETLPGRRVLVPLGKRTVTGFVVGVKPKSTVKNVRDIIDLLDAEPLFDERRLKFYRWISSYYLSAPGQVFSLICPPGANVKSLRFFTITEDGLKAVEGKKGLAGELLAYLAAANKGVPLTALLKRFKDRPLVSDLERLKAAGLVTEEARLKRAGPKVQKFLSPVDGAGAGGAEAKRGWRSKVQEKVFNYVLRTGGASLRDVKREFGTVDHAVKRLVEKGLLNVTVRSVHRDPMSGIEGRAADHEPNPEQAAAISEITTAVHKKTFAPFLLYGVTGSGKTLVYLKVLEEVLQSGKKALFLVPEIALTPWPAAYLKERFPGHVALMHSGLSAGERLDEWRRIASGGADIVTGTRSALFAPIRDLSLIIVDEEHDPSYKQEEGVKYNGRDAALMLGRELGITVVLGSATPSVESFYNSSIGKLTPLFLNKRVEDRSMPAVEVLDMRGKKGVIISERLSALMTETLERGEQALLFLNRRGFSSCLVCGDCGHAFTCPNCSVTLTLHKRPAGIRCHYCGYAVDIPEECPECKGINLIDPGIGTEKVEQEVKRLLPGARVLRMDRDTARRKGAVNSIIEAMEDRSADVLVGTQMVSKGHHFPGITLVGIISGDTSLNIPDFRSPERTFQLLTQAAGRAGRGTNPGTVVIQTLNPEHYCFRNVISHDYGGFYSEEIHMREELSYPPFTRLCALRLEGRSEVTVAGAAAFLKTAADAAAGGDKALTLLGPVPGLVAKVKGLYRYQMLVKGRDLKTLHAFLISLKKTIEAKRWSGVRVFFDMDPITIV